MGEIYTKKFKNGDNFLIYVGSLYLFSNENKNKAACVISKEISQGLSDSNKYIYNNILYYKIREDIKFNVHIILYKQLIKTKTKKEQSRKYYEHNKEEILEKQKAYYQQNKNSYCLYYKKNKQHFHDHYIKHYEANKDYYKKYNKKYYESNKEKLKAQQKEKYKNKHILISK
jgi:hypothetical protein